jgi:hypothetical protein
MQVLLCRFLHQGAPSARLCSLKRHAVLHSNERIHLPVPHDSPRGFFTSPSQVSSQPTTEPTIPPQRHAGEPSLYRIYFIIPPSVLIKTSPHHHKHPVTQQLVSLPRTSKNYTPSASICYALGSYIPLLSSTKNAMPSKSTNSSSSPLKNLHSILAGTSGRAI